MSTKSNNNNNPQIEQIKEIVKSIKITSWQTEQLQKICIARNGFIDFLLQRYIEIGLNMQQRRDDYHMLGENTLRSFICTTLQSIFDSTHVSVRENNGRTDIFVINPWIKAQNVITECLSWTTAKKNPSKASYEKKLEQLFGYQDLQDSAFLITFVTDHDLDDVIAESKKIVEKSNFLQSQIITRAHPDLSNYRHLFECRYLVSGNSITVYHLFIDLKKART